MKVKLFLLIVILSVLSSSNVFSQNIRAELKAFLREAGYTISNEKYAMLSEGEIANYYRNFYSSTKYAIVAYTEESGVKDVDLYLYDDDGSLLVKDTTTKRFAIVEYNPYVTRKMKVVFKNYNSRSSYKEYKCHLIVAFRK